MEGILDLQWQSERTDLYNYWYPAYMSGNQREQISIITGTQLT